MKGVGELIESSCSQDLDDSQASSWPCQDLISSYVEVSALDDNLFESCSDWI